MDSILQTVRTYVGGEVHGTAFDSDLCVHINGAFALLVGRGLHSAANIRVKDDTATWQELGVSDTIFSHVQTFVCAYTKLNFDPPANATLVSVLKDAKDEAAWHIQMWLEHTGEEE